MEKDYMAIARSRRLNVLEKLKSRQSGFSGSIDQGRFPRLTAPAAQALFRSSRGKAQVGFAL